MSEEAANVYDHGTDPEEACRTDDTVEEINGPDKGENLLDVLEGLLFLTGDEGLKSEQAAGALGISCEACEALFEKLCAYYEDAQRGIEVARYGDTYRFLSKERVHPYAEKLFQITRRERLSPAALETLAIIAYKQPVTRVEIEEIRGVDAEVMLRKLLARNMIREEGRADAPGRPILYCVTEDFMDSFSLMSLDELPELPDFGTADQEGSDELFRR